MSWPAAGSRAGRARIAAAVLAGLLATGCAAGPAGRPPVRVAACIQAGTNALRHHITLTALPAACQGLSPAGLSYAAEAAAAAAASSGPLRGKILMRARRRELSPLVPHLAAQALPRSQPAAAVSGAGGPPARLAALAAWLVTAGLGLWLMAGWLTRAMLRRPAGRGWSRLRMNLYHLGLALAGLLSWVSYLLTGLPALAWLACVLLLPVAGLGMALLFLRLPGRRPRSALAVAAHVAVAVVAMLLSLLAAVSAG